jgi:hypothetical protein
MRSGTLWHIHRILPTRRLPSTYPQPTNSALHSHRGVPRSAARQPARLNPCSHLAATTDLHPISTNVRLSRPGRGVPCLVRLGG